MMFQTLFLVKTSAKFEKKRLFTTKVLFSATDVYFYQNRCIDFYFSPVAAIAKYSYAPDPHAQNKKLKHFINKKNYFIIHEMA